MCSPPFTDSPPEIKLMKKENGYIFTSVFAFHNKELHVLNANISEIFADLTLLTIKYMVSFVECNISVMMDLLIQPYMCMCVCLFSEGSSEKMMLSQRSLKEKDIEISPNAQPEEPHSS